MIASLKSELRKLWTVRSTYVIFILSVGMICFFAFYIDGFKAGVNSRAIDDPMKLAGLVRDAISSLAVFGAIVGILSVTHEYRYNTIMHTLTSSKSRTVSLFAKVIAVSIFAIFFTIIVTALAIAAMYLGLAAQGLTLGPQTFETGLLWRALFFGWGFSMFGLIIAVIVRQQVGAIVLFLLIPTLGENIAGAFLKDNRVYLPFTALMQVLQPQIAEKGQEPILTTTAAMVLTLVYIIIGSIVSWVLFVRRDAN